MYQSIQNSIPIVNKLYVYILLIGILGIQVYPGLLYKFTYVGILISYIIEIILLGKLSIYLATKDSATKLRIFRENWLNYLIISVLLATPVFLIGQLSNIITINPYILLTFKVFVSFIIASLAIYALPIAFIKNENIKAIMVSVYYLITNFNYSKPILLLLAASYIASLIPAVLITLFPSLGIYGIIPFMILFNIVATYIYALIFCAATITLVNKNEALQEQA